MSRTALSLLAALAAVMAVFHPCSAKSMWNPYARQWLGQERENPHLNTHHRHPSLKFDTAQVYEEKREFPRYQEKREFPRYGEKRDFPRYEEKREFPHYEEKRDFPRYEEKRDSNGYDCCGLGYRAEWVGWDKRSIKTYCEEDLPCCDGLESKEIDMWGGFGFSLCVKTKQEKRERKPLLNPFTRYLGYYSDLPDSVDDETK